MVLEMIVGGIFIWLIVAGICTIFNHRIESKERIEMHRITEDAAARVDIEKIKHESS